MLYNIEEKHQIRTGAGKKSQFNVYIYRYEYELDLKWYFTYLVFHICLNPTICSVL